MDQYWKAYNQHPATTNTPQDDVTLPSTPSLTYKGFSKLIFGGDNTGGSNTISVSSTTPPVEPKASGPDPMDQWVKYFKDSKKKK